MKANRGALAFLIFAAAGAIGGYLIARNPNDAVETTGDAAASGSKHTRKWDGDCSARVTKEELERSVQLGTQYMVTHQKPEGNFDYEYDWKAKTNSSEDSSVRQAGALWGISLLHAAHPTPKLKAGVLKGLAYFDDASRTTSSGGRYPLYKPDVEAKPSGQSGMGMPALVTLAIVDYVRTLPEGDEKAKWTARAGEYITFLTKSMTSEGLWPGEYKHEDGAGVGKPSPYVDGEVLLALVVSMKYLGRDDLRPTIERAAAEGHKVNVEKALEKSKDSTTTKGYYQWSSMAYYELATSAMGGPTSPYGGWLMSLADWIIDVHQVIGKPRNTGYAYEGIVSAYAWAKQIKDPRAEKYFCAIHKGLSTLLGWQVGHPRAASLGGADDPRAAGGVQNHETEPPLRIDVVQHQMHATMLAIEHLFGPEAGAPPPAPSASAAPVASEKAK